MEELLSLLSCIAPVLSQAPEQSVWPRLSEQDGGGPGKDRHEWLEPGAWGCQTKRLATQSAEATFASFGAP